MTTRKIIIVTAPDGAVAETPIENVERLAVLVNGCYTEEQTINAMRDGNALRDGLVVKRNGWTLEPFVTPECSADCLCNECTAGIGDSLH